MVANRKGVRRSFKMFRRGRNSKFIIFYLLSLISPSIPHSPALHHTIPLIFGAKIGDNLAFRQLHFARTARIIEA